MTNLPDLIKFRKRMCALISTAASPSVRVVYVVKLLYVLYAHCYYDLKIAREGIV